MYKGARRALSRACQVVFSTCLIQTGSNSTRHGPGGVWGGAYAFFVAKAPVMLCSELEDWWRGTRELWLGLFLRRGNLCVLAHQAGSALHGPKARTDKRLFKERTRAPPSPPLDSCTEFFRFGVSGPGLPVIFYIGRSSGVETSAPSQDMGFFVSRNLCGAFHARGPNLCEP